jgi:hypothetical protein
VVKRIVPYLTGVGVRAILVLAIASPAHAQGDRSFAGPFVVDRALAVVYGGPTWQDAGLRSYADYEDDVAFVEALFDVAYVEDGVDKHVVIATLTPRPRSQHSCHACAPLLGGAVFRASGSSWEIEAAGRIIGRGHAWYGTASSLELVRIGPGRYGLVHRIEDVSGGYENKSIELIFPRDGALAVQFSAPVLSGPGPGACGIPEEQHLRLAVDETNAAASGAGAGLFDLVVDSRWNDARCLVIDRETMSFEGQVCHRVSRFAHRDDHYVLVAHETDECTPLPTGVRISTRG